MRRVVAALTEPAMLVGGKGAVLFANAPAADSLGLGASGASGGDLARLCDTAEAGEALSSLLHRASGSGSALPGALRLRTAKGEVRRFRCHACRIGGEGPTRILLRFAEGGDKRFAELNRKIDELHEEVRRRRHLQVRLEEALRDRDLLVRELHHRVKNNLQTIVGLLHAAEREGGKDPAVVLREVSGRLAAAGAVHQILHQEGAVRGVPGATFLGHLGALIARSLGAEERFTMRAAPTEIPNDAAMPLALILNELLTNAVKHGAAGGAPVPVRASLDEWGDGVLELAVEDGGPGFVSAEAGAGRRASGLGLVRGLARQLGGAVAVERSELGGARCSVRFRPARPDAIPQEGS